MGLRPILKSGLRVVFVGTEPGAESLSVGHYYANPGNVFYSHLHRSGFTPRRLRYTDDTTLLTYGIGLDDVYFDPDKLRERLELFSPASVCFNSKTALEHFGRIKVTGSWRGGAAAEHVEITGVGVIWALPDSSGRASSYHEERLALMEELLKELTGESPPDP